MKRRRLGALLSPDFAAYGQNGAAGGSVLLSPKPKNNWQYQWKK